eukprot:scaffold93805_cov30-Cyclotella_meneghiniana.AAC.1
MEEATLRINLPAEQRIAPTAPGPCLASMTVTRRCGGEFEGGRAPSYYGIADETAEMADFRDD